ncbi:protein TRANSPARENT TESTA 12-like [Tripterygium wilfordii]|uniref:Protein TRANSPARENT TESTA 12-like n=1 Tax=Tripterygium wilfordii TaxID=458696 RepID=A0A7J7DI68_TRIWF|nr:protein TRANSPARENT TESTA 12-like [Tripterygium wilfordii]
MESSAKDINQPLLESKSPSITTNPHGSTSDELENILSDIMIPFSRRMWIATRIELKLLFKLAAPAVVVYMTNYLMSMSTNISCGQLGNLELAAASLGTTGIQLFAYGLMFGYIVKSEKCKYTWRGFSAQAFTGLPAFFKLSAASAVMLCLETWYFQLLVLLAGLLENPQLTLDSLSICLSIVGWAFMTTVGFNAAASVRVANELGSRHPKSAAFSVIIVNSVSLIISIIIAIIVFALRDVISYAFTEGEEVAAAVSDLCPLLAITIILNSVQPVLSGVAVGCGWQAFVAYVNVGCYYLVGIPLGVLLGFYFNLGAKVEASLKRLDRWEREDKKPLLS